MMGWPVDLMGGWGHLFHGRCTFNGTRPPDIGGVPSGGMLDDLLIEKLIDECEIMCISCMVLLNCGRVLELINQPTNQPIDLEAL